VGEVSGLDVMKTLKKEEARRLLHAAPIVRLGCIMNGEP
jgi:hypothetical protein